MEFHIDFGTIAQPAAHASPLFASPAGTVQALGNDRYLFRATGAGDAAPAVLPGVAIEALDACRAFGTLDEHAARLAQSSPTWQGSTTRARDALNRLQASGLLVDASAWLAEAAAARDQALAPRGPVFIRACDRPAQLRALLATLADNERVHRARHRYVVLDDSRDAANAGAHATALRDFARETGCTAVHLGAQGRLRLIDRLAAAVPSARNALHALLPGHDDASRRFGGGRGYTLAALLGAGTRYALLDDDFLLPLRSLATATAPMLVDAAPEQPTRFFDDVDAALAAGTAVPGDPVDTQLAWCGATLAQVWRAMPAWRPAAASLRGFAPSRAAWLGGDTRVVATGNGHRGSSGTARADWLLLLPRATRAVLTRDAAHYAVQREGGSLWTGGDAPRFIAQGHFTPFLVDGGHLVPPTPPAGRAEDLLFGMLCRAVAPRGGVLVTPYAIGHRQEGSRARAATLYEADRPGLNHFLNDWLGSRLDEIRADTPAARLATIAAMLADVAAAPAPVRIDLLREYLAFRRADLVVQLEEAAAEAADAPDFWRRDVAAAIAANAAALREPGMPRLAGVPDDADAPAIAARFTGDVGAFAEALSAWPALWQHAAERGNALLPD